MKASHTYRNKPSALLTVRFIYSAMHLETAIVALLCQKKNPTKTNIKKELVNMFISGGADGHADWVIEDDYDIYLERAKEICRKLYPTFYTD